MTDFRIITGAATDRLADLDAGSVQTCITSPPYWGLRDYGTAEWQGGDADCDHRLIQDHAAAVATSTLGGGKKSTGHIQEGYGQSCGRCGATRIDSQLGLEPTPEAYVANLVAVFREVRRVLRDDGTLWLNLGDSYAGSWGAQSRDVERGGVGLGSGGRAATSSPEDAASLSATQIAAHPKRTHTGSWINGRSDIKPKDLVGIPWMVAFALRADGWYLRSDIIWSKPNPMPESVTDRPTKAHEYLFLLTKSPRYFYDADAIREVGVSAEQTAHNERYAYEYEAHTARAQRGEGIQPGNNGNQGIHSRPGPGGANKRSVWTVSTQPFPGAHFATFPPKLIEPCVLAGSAMGDLVLDPFAGAGTTGLVALRHDRDFVGIELNPEYAAMARNRIRDDAPLFNVEAEA